MLPLVLSESRVFTFKFWFAGRLQDGMCYKNELYCRLRSFSAKDRGRVFYLGYKLSRRYKLVMLTVTKEECNLWISLRDPRADAVLSQAAAMQLPAVSPSLS